MSQRGASFRHKYVSSVLRALRRERRLSCKEVASALGFSEAKVSRMETGDRGLDADDVAAVLGFLRAPLRTRQDLMAFVRAGSTKNWQEINGQLPMPWTDLLEFESRATAIYNFEPLLIPGLAQTPDYARLIIRGSNDSLTDAQLETLIAARMGRQTAIGRVSVELLIDEMVLRRRLGDPPMMRRQLQHLRALARRPRSNVQVVPHDAAPHPGLAGPFLILDFADQASLVHVEGRNTQAFLEDAGHVARTKAAWADIREKALSPGDTVNLIADIVDELT